MAGLFISATRKSSGKTTISVGLAAALARRGIVVQSFKKGPDYIDPMWLALASGRPCYNLDFNTQTANEIGTTYTRHAPVDGLALVEGNKGLHDGVDERGADSSAALARLLGLPVVLVVDSEGMGRGIAALVQGYSGFDRSLTIAGVILNKVGNPRHEGKLRRALEHYTEIPVLGAIGRDLALVVLERHLGLTPPAEAAERDDRLSRMAAIVARDVDLDRLLAIAESASLAAPAPAARGPVPAALGPAPTAFPGGMSMRGHRDIRVGVARDAAFGFYYADDLDALEQAGAELVSVDFLRDDRLPVIDALFIGGGFPETQAAALAANTAMRRAVRTAIVNGLPSYAECGGLMYLTRSITYQGRRHEMAGVIQADSMVGDHAQGRGLVVLEETDCMPWRGWGEARSKETIPAHEFHYGALHNIDPSCRFAYRVRRGHGIDGRRDGIVVHNLLAGFSHLRDSSRHRWAQRFIAFARAVRHDGGARVA